MTQPEICGGAGEGGIGADDMNRQWRRVLTGFSSSSLLPLNRLRGVEPQATFSNDFECFWFVISTGVSAISFCFPNQVMGRAENLGVGVLRDANRSLLQPGTKLANCKELLQVLVIVNTFLLCSRHKRLAARQEI